jgi:exosortase
VNLLVQTNSPTALSRSPQMWKFGSTRLEAQLTVLGALSLHLYWTTIVHLVGNWRHDPNFSHGFFVPIFSGFVLWRERDRLLRIVPRPSWSGLAVIAGALCVFIVGQLGAELFLSRSSLLLLLAGIVIAFQGWSFFRAILFPWAFLFLMIPIPALIIGRITFPLQLLASRLSAGALELLQVPVHLQGNIISLAAGPPLEVAEACSGIRSLMSLVTLAIIYGYLLERRLWVRWLLALASVPIAVVANSSRIVGTGLLVQYWDAEKAEGYYHASWGWLVFVVALLMLYLVYAIVCRLWPDEGEQS